MHQERVIEVSGVFSGCAGWNACGMYARYVHMDARVGRGLGQSPRQISSLTGKKTRVAGQRTDARAATGATTGACASVIIVAMVCSGDCGSFSARVV